jgi:hypothetical protein
LNIRLVYFSVVLTLVIATISTGRATLLRREGLGGGGGSISEEVDEENVIMSHQQHAAD